ncbi:putative pyrophosphatase or phosphodiesterase, AlkP superfamily [Geosmithia morbida]|uniref:Pyrophosphatase or phosphodiesterase, AlkP superfamily n=1 Tax=Geosmithia morbida TaxID=1094350 RepID=A0A9P4YZ80_9HYPO|nr:putative pyrophosphatase or phosphodiesterase, AlkP superfamily [Geosmithia morbida]KAF4124466.1 putative pyrophosphatase or phosphodiesterase, AlkP superfamily [Geosmithia morbida]
MPPPQLNTNLPRDDGLLLSPAGYDDDASSIHTARSEQDTDSDDDELQNRARNSRELRARDRLVLMDEDEIEGLVASSWKKQDRRVHRQGSGLNVPNPLKMLKRRGSNASMASSADEATPTQATYNSQQDGKDEKRKTRRARREQRKRQIMEDAEHGEDGRLMYEMEAGAMREGSTTGDSSDREDSDEVDRRQLGIMNKAHRGRSWRRWILIYSLIAIGFAILVLGAWKLSKKRRAANAAVVPAPVQQYVSNGTALFAPTTILISLDGFRADFLQRGLTPRLNELVAEGVSPKYMLPSFPSVTFPNHYTIATGLYPESHGVVGNTFWDPELHDQFHSTDSPHSLDSKWWERGGEPFWVTAEKHGIRTAIHMWPGSEARILGVEPTIVDKYNGDEKLDNKVQRIFDLLDMPAQDENYTVAATDVRPQIIAAYVPDVDADGHRFGPNSTEVLLAITRADKMVGDVFAGLQQRNLSDLVNVIVVSDHGMATTDTSRVLQLEDLVDTSKIEHVDGWPLSGLRPYDDADLDSLYDQLSAKAEEDNHQSFEVYLRDKNMPERYHFSKSERIAPLWVVPKAGWAIVTKAEMDVAQAKADGTVYRPRGLHGYDHENPLMRAIFIARGPAFPHPANSELPVFQNIEVYNLLCDSVGIEPKPNNGTLRLPLKPIGTHKPEDHPAVPEDPATERPTVTTASEPIRPTAPAASNVPPQVDEPPVERPSSAGDGKEDRPPASNGDGGEEGEGGDKDKHKSFLGGMWDWVTHKVDKVLDTLKGSGSS